MISGSNAAASAESPRSAGTRSRTWTGPASEREHDRRGVEAERQPCPLRARGAGQPPPDGEARQQDHECRRGHPERHASRPDVSASQLNLRSWVKTTGAAACTSSGPSNAKRTVTVCSPFSRAVSEAIRRRIRAPTQQRRVQIPGFAGDVLCDGFLDSRDVGANDRAALRSATLAIDQRRLPMT